jgi:phage tail-like protein
MVAGLALAVALTGYAWSSASGVLLAQEDSPRVGRVSLSIDGFEIAIFSELAGISSAVEPVEGQRVRRSQATFSVVLGRPLSPSRELLEWHEHILDGRRDSRTAMLTVFDAAGQEVARYHLVDAWPAKIEIGALKAGASEVLMETVTFVCERITRVSP